VLHREHDVGALDGLGRDQPASVTGEIDTPLAQDVDKTVGYLLTGGSKSGRVDLRGDAALLEPVAQEGGREWRAAEVCRADEKEADGSKLARDVSA